MAGEVVRPYTDEQMQSDSVSKKDLVTWLQANANGTFLQENKLRGTLKNVSKTKTKEALILDYNNLFESKAFRVEGEEIVTAAAAKTASVDEITEKAAKVEIKDETPKYKKVVLKKGDKTNFARKGDLVSVFYTGRLVDGTVFDSNVVTGRKAKSAQPLKFKAGSGKVIKGWDEAILTMSSGEKAEITIEPEWAYGRRGVEGKVPANSTLIFEVELVRVE